MFISDRIVFVDLPKTASSHVRRILGAIEGGRESGVHVPVPARLRRSRAHIWGTIRNPWDWYVSLWAYGCSGRGALYQALTSDFGWVRSRGWKHSPVSAFLSLHRFSRGRRHEWQETYGDAGSAAHFQRWLQMIHDPGLAEALGDGYERSGISGFAGLMSWRFLRLYCAGPRPLPNNPQALQRYAQQHCYVTHFLRTDRLEQDLQEGFARAGRTLTEAQRKLVAGSKPSNRSRRRADPAYYYSPEAARLVADRDRLIIERFDFEAPTRAPA